MKKIITLTMVMILGQFMSAQVGIGTTTPDASAALDVTSNAKGMLVPRMSSAQRVMISSPAQGLLVYDTDTESFWFKGSTTWIQLIDSTKMLVHPNGNDIYMGMDGNTGIGISNPANKVDIQKGLRTGTHLTDNALYVTGPNESLANFMLNDGTRGVNISYNGMFASGSNPSNDLLLGSKGSNGNLIFSTNNLQRMSISPTGNVGIGLYAASSPLEFSSYMVGPSMVVLSRTGPNPYDFNGFGVELYDLRYNTGSMASSHVFYNNATELMRIKADGNVGIGNSNPQYPLQFGTGNGIKVMMFEDGSGYGGIGRELAGLSYRTANSDHVFRVDNNELMRLRPTTGGLISMAPGISQRVGIGVSDPETKLHVQGVSYFNDPVGIFNSTPTAMLQFSNLSANRKIVLSEINPSENKFNGFGTNPGVMRYQVASTNDNHVFYAATSEVASNELMRIQGNGNVGIGISTAENVLDIRAGSPRSGTHPTNRALYITGDFNPGSNGIEFRHSNGTEGIGFGYNGMYAAGSNANQGLGIIAKGPTGLLYFNTNDTTRLRILGNGDVGIDVNPSNQLDIHQGAARSGTHATNRPLYITGDLGPTSNGIEFRHNNGTQGIGFGYNGIYAAGSMASQSLGMAAKGPSGTLFLNTRDSTRMTIKENGNVNINKKLEIGYVQVGSGQFNVTPGQIVLGTCDCPPGTAVISGGYYVENVDVEALSSYPSSISQWAVAVKNVSPFFPYYFTISIICARLAN